MVFVKGMCVVRARCGDEMADLAKIRTDRQDSE
jgi:hypothetical protein